MSGPVSRETGERRTAWNADLYDTKHSFVWQFGADVITLLDPKPGEAILDLGCGTGHLAARIAETGARVVGVDRSEEMIIAAKKAHPNVEFEVRDARDITFTSRFDAVFSNAALHWMREPERVIAGVWNALRSGGRFVAEFGGKGNIQTMRDAFHRAAQEVNPGTQTIANPWYYPSVSEYATRLETQGFEVRSMSLFDRLTPLEEGELAIRHWIAMFFPDMVSGLSPEGEEHFLARVEELLRPDLYREGRWFADYRRLRFEAWR